MLRIRYAAIVRALFVPILDNFKPPLKEGVFSAHAARASLLVAILVSIPALAMARPEKVGLCVVDDVREASRPGWLEVNEQGLTKTFRDAEIAEYVPPLWTSNEAPITMAELAQRGAPILIFSPLEFLHKRFPRFGIPSKAGDLQPKPKAGPIVYYRIRLIRLRPVHAKAELSDSERNLVSSLDTTWSCDKNSRRVDELDYLAIRYFFYYPRDEGIGGHPHDLESLELQIRSRAFCTDEPTRCFYALTVVSAAGSAHGAGWYTNVLHVEDTNDTVLPLTVIVERDKHATSPDRDGNGIYQPFYDTNRYTKDAWGIRDVVASGWLGGAAFRGDFNDDRRDVAPLYPPHPATHLRQLYTAVTRQSWGAQTYDLRFSEMDSVCDRPFGSTDDEDRLASLLAGKDFCGDGGTEVKRGTAGLERFFQAISPGPSGRYGFMSYYQRLSFAMRYDQGFGVSMIAPVGLELRLFGGWLVPKINFVPTWAGKFRPNADVSSFSTDLLYAPTGSRVTDWYISGGAERWLNEDSRALRWGEAGEAGIKYRFNLEDIQKLLGFQFVGFRLAVRTTNHRAANLGGADLPSTWNTRIIFEVGAGSW